jgi:hypothetical protein
MLQEESAARGLPAKLRVAFNRLTEILNGKRGVSPRHRLAVQPISRRQRRVLAEPAGPV